MSLRKTDPKLEELDQRRDTLWMQLQLLLDVRSSVINELRTFDNRIRSALDAIEQEKRGGNDDRCLLD